MSSLRKIEANRANGAKSRGPKTPEGLQKSSMNALRYGLFAKTVVLGNESLEMFQAHAQAYVGKFQPIDEVEQDLVTEMVVAKWRQHRLWTVETAALDFTMDAQEAELAQKFSAIDEPTRLALAHKESMQQLTNIERCESSYRRQFDRALRNLLQLRKAAAPPAQPPAAVLESAAPDMPEPLRNEPNTPAHPVARPAATTCAPVRNEPTQAAPVDRNDLNREPLRGHVYGLDEAA